MIIRTLTKENKRKEALLDSPKPAIFKQIFEIV
jgi:hypothetical protein